MPPLNSHFIYVSHVIVTVNRHYFALRPDGRLFNGYGRWVLCPPAAELYDSDQPEASNAIISRLHYLDVLMFV